VRGALRLLALAALASSALCACGNGGGAVPTVTRGSLSVHAVDWNPGKADLGKVAAVADLGNAAALFGDTGLTVLVAGAVSATDASVTAWQGAGVIPAADGEGEWLVGVDGAGHVYSIDAQDQLEDVSGRFGLDGQKVRAVAGLGASESAFLLDGQIAVADGAKVTRYDLAVGGLAGGKGRLAGVASGAAHVFDLGTGKDSAFALPGAAFVAFDEAGKLVAATSHALYGEDDAGALGELIDLGAATVHGLASSPSGVWVAMDGEVGLLSGSTLGVSSGAALPKDATLAGSSSGDVWAISAGALSRYSVASAGDESLWTATVEPVFTRVCASCHLPGGTANIDLSYYGAWVARRQKVEARVIEKTPTPMPPVSSGLALTAADVAAIQAWVSGGSQTGK
jgi:mono/diheme cytochrome c family protein